MDKWVTKFGDLVFEAFELKKKSLPYQDPEIVHHRAPILTTNRLLKLKGSGEPSWLLDMAFSLKTWYLFVIRIKEYLS